MLRPDLNYVRILFDQGERFLVDCFGDDAKTESFAHFGEDLESRLAKALESVGRSPRLVGAATKKAGAGRAYAFGDGESLLPRLDRAGATDNGHGFAAESHFAGRRWHADDRVFFLCVAAHKLIRLADGNAFDDTGHRFERADMDRAVIARDADGRAGRARNRMGAETERLDPVANGANLFFCRVGLHHDEHRQLLGNTVS
jgi:hypothetical protein